MSKPEIQKVISHTHLEGATRDGWVVLESFIGESVVSVEGQEPRNYPSVTDNNGYNAGVYPPSGESGSCPTARGFVVKCPMFLVAKTKEAFFEEYDEKVAALEQQYQDVSRESAEALNKLAESEKRLAEDSKFVVELKGDVKRLGERLGDRHAMASKLEDDVSKIRTAIGDRQMQEILAQCANCHGAGKLIRGQMDGQASECSQCKGTGKVEGK